MQQVMDRLKLEREDVRQDLAGLNLLDISINRVGDFGCSWGYGTLSLMLELNPSECIGVDQFSGVLGTPTLLDMHNTINQMKEYCSIAAGEKSDIENLFTNGNLPSFQVGDLVTGTNLPENIDMAYCKHTLINIFNNGYNTNTESGESAVVSAFTNITHTLNHNGVFILVEPANDLIDFYSLSTRLGLNFSRMCRVHRRKIMGIKRDSILIDQDLIYVFLNP